MVPYVQENILTVIYINYLVEHGEIQSYDIVLTFGTDVKPVICREEGRILRSFYFSDRVVIEIIIVITISNR